jgi:hypothetical protein
MMRWVEEWTKPQAWGYPHTPRNIQEIQAPKLGDAPEAPLFYCFMHYAFFLEHLVFSFQFCFVLFAVINGWTPPKFLLEKLPCFSVAKNTPFFTLIVQRVFSFSRTAFSFHFFALIFVQIFLYLYIKVYFDLWFMLVFIKRVVSKSFKWCEKREKISCKKVV